MSGKHLDDKAFAVEVVNGFEVALFNGIEVRKQGLKHIKVQQYFGQSRRKGQIEGRVNLSLFPLEGQFISDHVRGAQVEKLERCEHIGSLFGDAEQKHLTLLSNTNLFHTFLPFLPTTRVLGGSRVVGTLSLRGVT